MSRPENPTIGFLRLRQRRILEVRESTLGRSFGHAPGVALSTYLRQEGKLRRGLSANDLEERWSPISEVCLDQDDIKSLMDSLGNLLSLLQLRTPVAKAAEASATLKVPQGAVVLEPVDDESFYPPWIGVTVLTSLDDPNPIGRRVLLSVDQTSDLLMYLARAVRYLSEEYGGSTRPPVQHPADTHHRSSSIERWELACGE